MTRRCPAHQRFATIRDLVAARPGLTARPLASAVHLSESAVLRYLGQLEAQCVVVSVLETPDEAWTRVMQETRSTLSRRYVRRKLRWMVRADLEVAA